MGYSGEHFDAKAQQQYLRARFYNPANGRFNRLDPFAGNMQDPQSLHKYAYVHGDPIQGIDPTGLSLIGMAGSLAIGGFMRASRLAAAHPVIASGLAFGAWNAVDTGLGGGSPSEILAAAITGYLVGALIAWVFSFAAPVFAGLPLHTQVFITSQLRVLGLAGAFAGAAQSFKSGNNTQGAWRASTGYLGSVFLLFGLNNAVAASLTGAVRTVKSRVTTGIPLVSTPNKTTTVLGSHPQDLENVLAELRYPVADTLSQIPMNGNPGGFNLLNVSTRLHGEVSAGGSGQFFNKVNKPWLDAAINRGDDIFLATPPEPQFLNRTDGTRSGFGKEYDYLEARGYRYVKELARMVRK